MKPDKLGLLFAIGAAFCFGLGNPFGTLTVQNANTFVSAFYVAFVAGFCLFLITLYRGKLNSIKSKDVGEYLKLGFIGFAIPQTLVLYAYTKTSALNVLFLLRSEIFFATILGALIFKEEIKNRQIGGIMLGFIGVFVFSTGLSFNSFNLADGIVFISTIFWAFYVVFAKNLLGKLDAITIGGMRYWAAIPFLFILAISQDQNLSYPIAQIPVLAIFSISTFVIGIILYNKAIESLGVWKAVVPGQLLSIIFGAIATWVVLGETLTAVKMGGGLLIIAGTVIALGKK
ncbi:DMT family transporter [Candidatus Micrarchaeota archaeon]|nr:DMT family transporter [Candidatus Micrarchaeota archaeon]